MAKATPAKDRVESDELAQLILSGLEAKEISAVLGCQYKSVIKARSRLQNSGKLAMPKRVERNVVERWIIEGKTARNCSPP